jgi:glucose-1-phosphate adenylyltransferase
MSLLGANPALDLASWQLRTNLAHEDIRDRGPAIINSASCEDIVAYNGVRIDGSVKRSILFPGVYVAPGAEIRDSILFFDTQIGSGARLDRTITDIGVTIGRDCVIGEKSGEITVIGMHAQVPKDTVIGPGCSVFPDMQGDNFTKNRYEPGCIIKC